MKKDEGNGKLAFFDRMSFEKVHEIEVTNAVSSASGSSLCHLSVPEICLPSFFWMKSDLGENPERRGVWAKEESLKRLKGNDKVERSDIYP